MEPHASNSPTSPGRPDPNVFLRPLAELPDPLPIPVLTRPFDVAVRPPGSKSITNRALLLAALADGVSELRGALVDADDARVMVRAVERLGARVEVVESAECRVQSAEGEPELPVIRVTGVGGRWKIPAGETVRLDLGNAGTATRFLTAAAVLAPAESGGVIIDGDARMRERPIGELIEALRSLNVTVDELGKAGCPPILVHALRSLGSVPGKVRFGHTSSSQFISALLLIAPFLPKGLEVKMPLQPTSESYISMTVKVLTLLGMERHSNDYFSVSGFTDDACTGVSIRPWPIQAFRFEIEPDASGATYFEAAAGLMPGARTTIAGLDLHPARAALQGDTHFVRLLTEMGNRVERLNGCMRVSGEPGLGPLDVDLSDMPDTAMTAAVLACFASPTAANPTATSTMRGLRTLRVKETDRLEALRVELTKIGARVEIFREGDDEGLRITPPAPAQHHLAHGGEVVARAEPSPPPVYFDTYNDHRMAMALALIGLRRPSVFIRNPACVAKTYPTYWRDFAKLYGVRARA